MKETKSPHAGPRDCKPLWGVEGARSLESFDVSWVIFTIKERLISSSFEKSFQTSGLFSFKNFKILFVML